MFSKALSFVAAIIIAALIAVIYHLDKAPTHYPPEPSPAGMWI